MGDGNMAIEGDPELGAPCLRFQETTSIRLLGKEGTTIDLNELVQRRPCEERANMPLPTKEGTTRGLNELVHRRSFEEGTNIPLSTKEGPQ